MHMQLHVNAHIYYPRTAQCHVVASRQQRYMACSHATPVMAGELLYMWSALYA